MSILLQAFFSWAVLIRWQLSVIRKFGCYPYQTTWWSHVFHSRQSWRRSDRHLNMNDLHHPVDKKNNLSDRTRGLKDFCHRLFFFSDFVIRRTFNLQGKTVLPHNSYQIYLNTLSDNPRSTPFLKDKSVKPSKYWHTTLGALSDLVKTNGISPTVFTEGVNWLNNP